MPYTRNMHIYDSAVQINAKDTYICGVAAAEGGRSGKTVGPTNTADWTRAGAGVRQAVTS